MGTYGVFDIILNITMTNIEAIPMNIMYDKQLSNVSIDNKLLDESFLGTTKETTYLIKSLGQKYNNRDEKQEKVKLKNHITGVYEIDTLHQKSLKKCPCTPSKCMGSIVLPSLKSKKSKNEVLTEALDFINQFYTHTKSKDSQAHILRLHEVEQLIKNTGTYQLTEAELTFGAQSAWRNASRCIGRIQWSKLKLFDTRHMTTSQEIFEAMCNHLKYATNNGNIRSTITVFRQRNENAFRIWNQQLVNYAGYSLDDNTIIGDPNSVEFTKICNRLGWKGKGTEFDILPIVIQIDNTDPEWFEIPEDIILEVKLTHPNYKWFEDLNLKWYSVPGIANMMLDVGGIEFTACPFNGWYMATEIGRDLADVNRYNKLPLIASKMGLDVGSNVSLWKDRALLELNVAILSSFQKANVTIVDHHSASDSFIKHTENEKKLRGGCPADWVWIVPPMSSHLTSVFHQEMLNYNLKPSFEYQEPAWKNHVWKSNKKITSDSPTKKKKIQFKTLCNIVLLTVKLMAMVTIKRVKCTILYATETGNSEKYANILGQMFNNAFNSKVICMSDYDLTNLRREKLLLIVTSTFGNGDPPEQAEKMKKYLFDLSKSAKTATSASSIPLNKVKFSVFALGNSSYAKFCGFGEFIDSSIYDLGADRLYEKGIGDELHDQEVSFKKWSTGVFQAAVFNFCSNLNSQFVNIIKSNNEPRRRILASKAGSKRELNLKESLSKWHNNKSLSEFELIYKQNLQSSNSGRRTLLIKLKNNHNLTYEPGDHIGICPSNRKEIVDFILTRIDASSEEELQVEITHEDGSTWIRDDNYPGFTIKTALTYYYDITTPLTQNVLISLASLAQLEDERDSLLKLAKNSSDYEKWKLDYNMNLAEILDNYSSIKLTKEFLVFNLPKLQPRYYSISSSPRKFQGEVHLTLLVVEFKPLKSSKPHYGVCSKMFDEMNIGANVIGFTKKATNFRLENRKVPIIMIGAGSGIAPFRSFWQENEISKSRRPMIQYFGCRNPDDELYRAEIQKYKSKSIINEYNVAYSRDNKKVKKTYVQDLLEKNSKSIINYIVDKKAHIYVCGHVKMANDVANTLAKILFKTGSQRSLKKAIEFIDELKNKNIYHEDIFKSH